MSLSNPNTPVSQQDLQDFYHKILPYMGGSFEAIANKFSKGDLYSTDEKMIGQWTDGKPLYQRVFDFGALPNKSTKDVLHNISDIDVVVSAIGIAYGANTNFYPIPYTSPDSLGDNILMTVSTTYVRIMTGYNRSNLTNCYIVLQYTKTTDSPISIGDDTDYSTEEKIVGTWVNGKPIYQRVVHFSPQQTSYQAYTVAFSTYFPDSVYTDIVAVSGFYNQTYYNNKLFDIEVQFDTNIIIKNASEKAMWTVDIIVCYTKTTD